MTKFIQLGLCFACLTSYGYAAGQQALEAGKKAEATYCVACHSTRIIDSQRLSAAAWTKEMDKMAGWGAVVPDKQLLIDYLATEYSNTKPVPVPGTSGNGVTTKSDK